MTLRTDPTAILRLCDAGHQPDAIATALSLRPGLVYSVLRQHRPARVRKPRRRTSWLRPAVLGLHGRGVAVDRIAMVLPCSKAYVYRILSEAP